ncbi:MAG: hypothetical protein Q9211_000782 [Gyalolechia sp. 1 TL-2023]
MILTGVLRHYATVLLASTPKKQDLPTIREQRSLIRGINLRNNAYAITPSAFAARKNYMINAYKEGTFLKNPESKGKPAGNPMTDPAAMEGMMGMMKGNMAMMVPQTLIMGWINAFFAGYVISVRDVEGLLTVFRMRVTTVVRYTNTNQELLVKLPFPLTLRFKSMLQSGVATRDLDVRWVSSLSWYFLNLFGLQSVFIFILGNENAANQMAQQMSQMNPGAGAGMFQPGQDADKVFQNEAENLEVLEHKYILKGIERRI